MDTLTQHVLRGMFLHAYGLEGSWGDAKPKLLAFAQQWLRLPLTGAHPDARLIEVDVFGIDESRSLERSARVRGIMGDKKLFVLRAQSLTNEAQNALLKLLEDPPDGLHVIVHVPSFSLMLPTLRSRLFLISGSIDSISVEIERVVQTFLKAQKKDRLEMVAPLIEAKDREGARALLNGIEVALSKILVEGLPTAGLRQVFVAHKYLSDRSSSIKLLLEQVALIL